MITKLTSSLPMILCAIGLFMLADSAVAQPVPVAVPQQNAVTNPDARLQQPAPVRQDVMNAAAVGQTARAAVANPGNQQIIASLQNLLNNQAAVGQFPNNNALLADVNDLIVKYSQTPSFPKVRLINSGPGTLRISYPNGSTVDVKPNYSVDIDLGVSQIAIVAFSQDVSISLEHLAHGPGKFWDQDDRRYTTLAPNQFGPAQKYRFTLTPGVLGHHLVR